MRDSWRYLIAIVGLALLVLLVMDFNNRINEMSRLANQRETVVVEVTQLVQTQFYLETQVAFSTSEAAVRQQAYEEGRLIAPGDVLVVPLQPPDSTPVPTTIPIVTPVTYSNWEYWLALFFEDRP